MEKEKEEKRKKEIKENKIKLRKIIDKQIEYKKARKEFEKQVNLAKERIWEQDYKNYINYQKEINKKIRELNRQNNLILDNQAKAGKIYDDLGMSDTEKAKNRELLEKANS